MRTFIIMLNEVPTSLVFHDPKNAVYYCRSKSEAFRRAFNAVCGRILNTFVKENNSLFACSYGPADYDWIDKVLEELCVGVWAFKEIESLQSGETNIDEVVSKYL